MPSSGWAAWGNQVEAEVASVCGGKDVTRILKAVKAADCPVDRIEISDRLGNKTVIVMGQGNHTVRVGSDNKSNERNPWDEVSTHAPDQNRPP
jgi:hypothetical protein